MSRGPCYGQLYGTRPTDHPIDRARPVSAIASAYVRRHVIWQVNRTKKSLVLQLAEVANDQGRTRAYTQRDAADDMGVSLISVKRAFRAMMRPRPGAPGPFVLKLGNGRYEILGVVDHDRWSCDNEECQAEAVAARDNGGKLSEKKRQQAAARARAFRA